MLKALLIASAFPAAVLWSQAAAPITAANWNVDSVQFAPVGVTSGQTLRINVFARAPHSCVAQVGFLDSGGKPIGPSSSVSLKAGESAYLDLPPSVVAAKPGQRVEIRPRLKPSPSTIPSACQISVSVRGTAAESSPRGAKESKPAGGTQEGVHVQGQWTIEVRNPDGTLVTHREFENSLTPDGGDYLVGLLSQSSVPRFWSVWFNYISLAPPCPNKCVVGQEITFPGEYPTLVLSTPTSGPYNGNLVLTGSFSAPGNGSLTDVATIPQCCPVTTVTTCQNTPWDGCASLFTSFTFPVNNPILVATGQIVQFTVALGFM
jgi:hypothetical protein